MYVCKSINFTSSDKYTTLIQLRPPSQPPLSRARVPSLRTIAGEVDKMGLGAKIGGMIRNDPNLPRLGKGVVLGARGLRAGAGTYFVGPGGVQISLF